ncbi:MAG: ferredoxin [Cyanobacteria bacterium P01_H01_bin.121]
MNKPEQDSTSGNSFSGNSFAPELGGDLRFGADRSGYEPELGGLVREQAVYVDEVTCIGCKHCAHVAPSTFYIEPDQGRSRVIKQDGDSEAAVQEAIDMCPVDCIHWVDYKELKKLEAERQYQVVPTAGFPVDRAGLAAQARRQQRQH